VAVLEHDGIFNVYDLDEKSIPIGFLSGPLLLLLLLLLLISLLDCSQIYFTELSILKIPPTFTMLCATFTNFSLALTIFSWLLCY